jgi:hypothetical protein
MKALGYVRVSRVALGEAIASAAERMLTANRRAGPRETR